MILETLSDDDCWRLLATRQVGRLAVSIANQPDIFPLNYRVEDETLVVRTAPGLKLAGATLGAGVAFEVDGLDEMRHTGWSVVVHGLAEEIEALEEWMAADRLLIEPWAEGERDRLVRITPSKVSGRRIGPNLLRDPAIPDHAE
jgi:uncharacterized protein